MNNRIFFKVLLPAVLLLMSCSNQDEIDKQKERIDELENTLNGIVKQLQSLVYVPETNGVSIRVDGTNSMTLRYRVEPKKLATSLASYSQQLKFEGKTDSPTPSLTITNAQGDDTAGVLTLTVTPSTGFEHDGDYAFSLTFTDNVLTFASAYTPVFVVTHPVAVDITCSGIVDLTKQQMVGNSIQLLPSFIPIYTTETGVTWSSSDSAVAEIDDNGLVHFLASGTVTLTVVSADISSVTNSITLQVTGDEFPVDSDGDTGQDEAE